MIYPSDGGASAGYSTYRFSEDSRQLTQATMQLRSYVLSSVITGNAFEIDRITRYYLYWKFYENLHFRDFNESILSFNYVRALIDKVNMFLLGSKGFTFQVKSFTNEQVERDFEDAAEKAILYHWNKNKLSTIAYEILQMGSVCGDVWVGLEWIDDEVGGWVKIRPFDSRQCFPYFLDGDYAKLINFTVRFPLDRDMKANPNQYLLKVYSFTDTVISSWYQKDLNHDINSIVKYEVAVTDNPYGFIPVVHIKNRPFSAGYYGKSDANDILKVNKIYNEMMQQEKSIIDYHATPTTVITGGTARNLRRGLGNIWSGLPPEANVFNLGLDVDLSQLTEFTKTLKQNMHELSDVPENSLGKIQAISNTSAAALNITYQPLVQQADLKGITYGDGISELNSMIFKMQRYHQPQAPLLTALDKLMPDWSAQVWVDPVFTYGLPTDKQNELNMGVVELNSKIASRREVMERLGKNNIPDLLREIEEDNTEIANMQAETQSVLQEAMGQGNEGGEEGNNEDENDGEEPQPPTNEQRAKMNGKPA